ncbi:MAG: hypothetical protein WDO16_23580 [Bacteroidota bacterium]
MNRIWVSGRLDYECYNGHARIINSEATPVEFTADSLLEKSTTSVFVINDAKGNFSAGIQRSPGYYESTRFRNKIKERGKEALFNDFKKMISTEAEISNTQIDSLNKYDDPLFIKYTLEVRQG